MGMDPDHIIENAADIIESLAQAVTRSQERLDKDMGDLRDKLESLKEELANLRTASATGLVSFSTFRDRLEQFEESTRTNHQITQAQIAEIRDRLQIAHEWILLEKERRKIAENAQQKEETRAWREQVTQILVRFGALLAAGAAGGGMSAALKILGVS